MMDTSREYVRMCEGAEEIQERLAFKAGDWLLYRGESLYEVATGSVVVVGVDIYQNEENPEKVMVFSGYDSWEYTRSSCWTWLPRQDELQEMVSHKNLNRSMSDIYAYYCDRIGKLGNKTWEQLWLAFVMKEKYGKVWTGTEWKRE